MEIEHQAHILPDFQPSRGLLTGLAMGGGLGLLMVVLALAFGAAGGAATNASLVGIGVLTGLLILVASIGGWAIAVQPFRKFDDINQPLDDGHHAHATPPVDHADLATPAAH